MRFMKICVLRTRFASNLAIEEMSVHSYHLLKPGRPPGKATSLLTHGRFAPVNRKEILTVIEESEQDLYLYEPSMRVGTEPVPAFKFCIFVVVTYSLWAKVEAACSKDAVVDVSIEGFVLVRKLLEVVGIVGVETWCPCC
jgi:hypothetical protein